MTFDEWIERRLLNVSADLDKKIKDKLAKDIK